MDIKLETDRLYFREFTLEDAALLYDMHLDPAITKYTGDPFPWESVNHAREIIGHTIMPQYELGIGRWAAHLKNTHDFIGWCGLKKVDGEYDLGYRYIQKYWKRGYALEAAKGVLNYGVSKNIDPIIGRASVANVASVKVLERIGLTFQDEYFEGTKNEECVKFQYLYL